MIGLGDFGGGVRFWGTFALFVLPGYLTARLLHGGNRGVLGQLACGFVYSMAVFAMPAWPCLWLGLHAEVFWPLVGVVFAGFTAAALWLGHRSIADGPSSDCLATPGSDVASVSQNIDPKALRFAIALVVAYLSGAAVMAIVLGRRMSHEWGLRVEERFCLAACLALGLVVARELRVTVRRLPWVDHRPAAHAARTCALLIALALAVGAAVVARPDWDDTDYLSTILRNATPGPLNREASSLSGENLPVAPHMRLLAWELFGATLCRVSGLHPMITHHTLLPPVLVLLACAANWCLLEELVPKRLVPTAFLVVAAWWLFGGAVYDAPGNFLLTRAWQGKSMLLALSLPVEVIALLRFLSRPTLRAWVACLLAATGALAMSSSAVYLLALLVPLTCLVVVILGGSRPGLIAIVAALTTIAPAVVYGLVIRSAFWTHPVMVRRLPGHSWLQSVYWCTIGNGSWELFWLLSLPILWALLPDRRARAYLIGLPVAVAVAAGNPWVYPWVAGHLTSFWTYQRVFWLFPFGVGLGVLLARLIDLVAWQQPGAVSTKRWLLGALLIYAGLATFTVFGGGRFVFGPWNAGPYPGLSPTLGENPRKVPSGLCSILERLSREGPMVAGRVAFSECLSPFVVPYDSRIRALCSRPSYTVEALTAAGRPNEGEERARLSVVLLGFRGTATESLDSSRLDAGLNRDQLVALLDKYDTRSAVTDQPQPEQERRLRSVGFTPVEQQRGYILWRRGVELYPSENPYSTTPSTMSSVNGTSATHVFPASRWLTR